MPVSSSNSLVSSAVIRSSDGLSTRQSMYSAYICPLAMDSCFTFIGLPDVVRRKASDLSRIAGCADSGMPSNIPITRMGISAPRSAAKSNRSLSAERIEAGGAEVAHLLLQRGHPAGREHP